MRGNRHLLARALMLGTLGASLPGAASAARPTITIGEVSARAPGVDMTTGLPLRMLIEQETGGLEIDQPRRADRYVFSASLVRLDAHASREGSRASCVVSGALRRAGSGALLATMRGSGTVDDDRSAIEGARMKALEVAVHAAIRRLP